MKRMELGIVCVLAFCTLCFMSNAFALAPDKVRSRHIKEADGTSGQDTNKGSGVKTGHIQDKAITDAKISDVSIEKVTGLQTLLNSKADAGHVHSTADVTNLDNILDALLYEMNHTDTTILNQLNDLSAVVDTKADSDHVHYYGNMTVVATSGGEYTSPVEAMRENELKEWCGTPSAENPCLLKILPGVYKLSSPVVMQPFVDLAGSGENVTILKGMGPGTYSWLGLLQTSAAEVRSLTVDSSVGKCNFVSIAISNQSGMTSKITDVTAIANNCGRSIAIEGDDMVLTNVTAKSFGGVKGTFAIGVRVGGISSLQNVNAMGSQQVSGQGISIYTGATVSIMNSTAEGNGTSLSTGVTNLGKMFMSNVVATASGPGSNVGVQDNGHDSEIINSRISGVSSLESSNGIGRYWPNGDLSVHNSVVTGNFYTTPDTTSITNENIANTMIDGMVINATKCLIVYDGNFDPIFCQ